MARNTAFVRHGLKKKKKRDSVILSGYFREVTLGLYNMVKKQCAVILKMQLYD